MSKEAAADYPPPGLPGACNHHATAIILLKEDLWKSFATPYRQDRLYFVLILPDGSKSLIPADWTDFAAASPSRMHDNHLIGSLEDLLQLRFLADALLQRAATSAAQLFHSRRAMPQLNLNFLDIPIPETCLWEELDDEYKQLVIETLARLMLNAVRTGKPQEAAND